MEINKEYYLKQLDLLAEEIKARKEDILYDWGKGIAKINISSEISMNSCLTLDVTKTYIPKDRRETYVI